MALKKNVFTDDLVVLLDSITDLLFAVQLQEIVTKRAISSDSKDLLHPSQDLKPKFGSYFHGTVLPVQEYFRSKDWRKLFITNRYQRQNATEENAHELAREIEGRIHANAICAVFEVMEVYLCRIGGKLLFQCRSSESKCPIPFDKQDIERKLPKNVLENVGTVAYYQEYMKRKYRNGYTSFLTDLGLNSASCKSEAKYSEAMTQLTQYFRAVEFIRHQTVHSNGRYEEKKLKRLGEEEQDSIRFMTHQSKLFKSNMILPQREHAEAILRQMAGLGLFLHQILGKDLGMELKWPCRLK